MSLAISSVAMSAIGAYTNAVGAKQSARSNQLNLQGQAIIADANSKMALMAGASAAGAATAAAGVAASNAKAQAEDNVVKLTKKGAQVKSSQRASMAARGLDLSEGTPVEVQASTDTVMWDEIDSVRADAARAAWGYSANGSAQAASIMAGAQAQAFNYSMEAGSARGSAGSISPNASFTSSLLSGAGQVARQWYGLYKAN